MAVYTDVAADDLTEFLAGYDIGELLSYKGIAEGVENSNFLVHTGAGNFILTLYEKRVAAGDLPFFLGLMEHLAARGITCPQPVKNRQGGMLGRDRRPAGGDRHLSRRHVDPPAERRPLRGGRRGAGAAASGRRRFPDAAAERAVDRQLAAALRAGQGRAATACGRACAPRSPRSSTRWRKPGRAICRGRDPCRSVSRQRVLPRRQAVRADRFLFRLHRYARLRRRDLPQRLVLRAGSFLQRHQGPRAAQGLRQGARAVGGRARGAAGAGARRGHALPADAAGRLAGGAGRRAGQAEGSAGIFPQAALPPVGEERCDDYGVEHR